MSKNDRGKPQRHDVNGDEIKVTPRFSGKKQYNQYRAMAEKFLRKINANQVRITTGVDGETGKFVEVQWMMNASEFEIRVDVFDTQKANMGAIAYYLRDWWRHIKRGIINPLDSLQHFEKLPGQTQRSTNQSQNELVDKSVSELKQLIKAHHPDTGDGDVEKYQQAKRALDEKRGYTEVQG